MSDLSSAGFDTESRKELERLSVEIRRLDDSARATARTAIELAMETGRKLIEAREVIERDESIENKEQAFGEWRLDNFSAPTRTMREYMNLARAFDGKDIGQIPQSVLKDLAAPKNEKIRDAAFEELSGREEITVKEAREVIDEHRINAGLQPPKVELTPEEQAQKRLNAMVELFGIEQVKLWLDAFD